MGYLFFDRDSGIGYYMSDEEFKEGCGLLACGIGILALYSLIACVLAAIVVTPLFVLAYVDDFFKTIVANNLLVFFVLTIALIVCKSIPKLANMLVVRIVFDLFIIALVLFLFFYLLNFAALFYSIIRAFASIVSENSYSMFLELFGNKFYDVTNGHWFYEFLNGSTNIVKGWVYFFAENIKNIDNASLNTAIGESDILLSLKTIGAYIINGVPIFIIVIIGGLLLIAILLLTILIPYLIALIAMVLLNKLFCYIKTRNIANIKTPKDYNAKIRINIDELKIADTYSRQKEVEVYRDSAKAGNPMAQFLYANELLSGKVVLLNEEEAIKWFKKAAYQNMAEAQYMVAFAYYSGIGVKKDKTLAKAWLMVALKNKKFVSLYKNTPKYRENTILIMKKCKYSDIF